MNPFSLAMLAGLLMLVPSAWADPVSDQVAQLRESVQQLTAIVQQLTATVHTQQLQLTALEQANTSLRVPGPVASGLGRVAQSANPEIGVVAEVVGQLSESSAEGEGNDKLSVREVELVFGNAIDPYSRFDSTITFSDIEDPEIEEAYITHWGLPGEVKARLGRMRPKIGKASAVHGDALDTVDEPLVVSAYLGAEGLFRTGLELSGFLPMPWTAVTHELTAGVMEGGVGEGGTLFGETRRRPSLYAHLKNFWDVTDMTHVELGMTYLVGSNDEDAHNEVHALGLDGTLVHYVTPNNKLKWQNELYLQDRLESFTSETDPVTGGELRTDFSKHPWGVYSLLDYRVSPRVGIGGRFDYVEPVDVDPAAKVRDADLAWTGYVTFYQSEFARWRLQFRRTDFARGGDDNTLFAQGTVAIGVHKHQLQ